MLPGPPRSSGGSNTPPRSPPQPQAFLPPPTLGKTTGINARGASAATANPAAAAGPGAGAQQWVLHLLQQSALSPGAGCVCVCVCVWVWVCVRERVRVRLFKPGRDQRMREGAVGGETNFNHSTFSSATSQGDPQEGAQVVLKGSREVRKPRASSVGPPLPAKTNRRAPTSEGWQKRAISPACVLLSTPCSSLRA